MQTEGPRLTTLVETAGLRRWRWQQASRKREWRHKDLGSCYPSMWHTEQQRQPCAGRYICHLQMELLFELCSIVSARLKRVASRAKFQKRSRHTQEGLLFYVLYMKAVPETFGAQRSSAHRPFFQQYLVEQYRKIETKRLSCV